MISKKVVNKSFSPPTNHKISVSSQAQLPQDCDRGFSCIFIDFPLPANLLLLGKKTPSSVEIVFAIPLSHGFTRYLFLRDI